MDVQITERAFIASNQGIWALLLYKEDERKAQGLKKTVTRDSTSWRWGINLYSVWFTILPRFGFRTRRWKERLARVRLFLTPGPVYVAFGSFCCDTGPFTWGERFPHGPAAWKATHWKNLDGGDGPGGFRVLKRQEDIDEYFPPPCDHEYYVGPVGQCGVKICWKCGNHEGLARCFCGWSASGGDGARELEAMGETL